MARHLGIALLFFAEATWLELEVFGPSARSSHAAVWSHAANGFYVFGGSTILNGSGWSGWLDDLWIYGRQANRWDEINPYGSAPPARYDHTAAGSDTFGGFFVFGGYGSGGYLNDLWLYNRQVNVWYEVNVGDIVPPNRSAHSAVWSDTMDGMFIFGGKGDGRYFNDLWFYSSQAQWREVQVTGFAFPHKRYGHSVVGNDVANGLFIFGGIGGSTLNDLWFYFYQANMWQEITPSGSLPPARSYHTAVGSGAARRGFFVFGGLGSGISALNDLWFYNDQDNIWEELDYGDAPARVERHSAAWSDAAFGFFVFGGYSASGMQGGMQNGLWVWQTTTTSTMTSSTQTSVTVTSSTKTMTTFTSSTVTTSTTTPVSQVIQDEFLVVASASLSMMLERGVTLLLETAVKAALLQTIEGINNAQVDVTYAREGGRRLQATASRRWKASFTMWVLAEKVYPAIDTLNAVIRSENADFINVLRDQLVRNGYPASFAESISIRALVEAPFYESDEFFIAVMVTTGVVFTILLVYVTCKVRKWRRVRRLRKEVEKQLLKENPRYRWAMISARFDGGKVEKTFREVYRILKQKGCNILMVEADSGDDFGDLTMQYLNQIHEAKGVMLAVCTHHYGERTKSPYSSHAELIYALDKHLEVLPLKVEDTYPPEPPCGPTHAFDKRRVAMGLIGMIFKSSVVFQDCVGKTAEEIADALEKRLDKSAEIRKKIQEAAAKEFSAENPGYRWAMVSARFDGGKVEKKFREVYRILKEKGCNILMVPEDHQKDDFGLLAREYLNKIKETNGVMLSVCTQKYGEKTPSSVSTHEELEYARANNLEVWALKAEMKYPPEPPSRGQNRRRCCRCCRCCKRRKAAKDTQAQSTQELLTKALPKLPKADCVGDSAEDIATELQGLLRIQDCVCLPCQPVPCEAEDEACQGLWSSLATALGATWQPNSKLSL